MKFGMWTTIWQKNNIQWAISRLTTTTQTTAQATGGGGVWGICGRGSKGPHHHQQDFTIFSLRREPPLLVYICNNANAFKTLLLHKRKPKFLQCLCNRPNNWPKVIRIGQNLSYAFAMLQMHLTPQSQIHKCIWYIINTWKSDNQNFYNTSVTS